jgi:hypothetical protein
MTEFMIGLSEREAVRLSEILAASPDRLAKQIRKLIAGQFREIERERRGRRQHFADGRGVLSRHGEEARVVAALIAGREPVYELGGTPKRWRRASLESLTRGEFYMYKPADAARAFTLNGTRYEMRLSLPPHTYRYEAVAE